MRFQCKIGREDFSNNQSGMRVYTKLVVIMGVGVINFAMSKKSTH